MELHTQFRIPIKNPAHGRGKKPYLGKLVLDHESVLGRRYVHDQMLLLSMETLERPFEWDIINLILYVL